MRGASFQREDRLRDVTLFGFPGRRSAFPDAADQRLCISTGCIFHVGKQPRKTCWERAGPFRRALKVTGHEELTARMSVLSSPAESLDRLSFRLSG